MFFSGDIVLSEEKKTILDGQWISNKDMTLKSFKKMDYLRDSLGKLRYTINGSEFLYDTGDFDVTFYFRVLSNNNEIQIELFHVRLKIFDYNLLIGSIRKVTYLIDGNCLLEKRSTEYFCK